MVVNFQAHLLIVPGLPLILLGATLHDTTLPIDNEDHGGIGGNDARDSSYTYDQTGGGHKMNYCEIPSSATSLNCTKYWSPLGTYRGQGIVRGCIFV